MALINCPECNKEISDTVDVCIHCGYALHPKKETAIKSSKKSGIFLAIAIIALIVSLFTPRILVNMVLLVVLGSSVVSLVRGEKFWGISIIAFLLGIGLLFQPVFKEVHQENYKRFLKVVDHSWDQTSSQNYSYIRGSVKNDGDKTVRYFKVKASFLNSSYDVIDSETTIEIQTLSPGESKEFEIMHPNNSSYHTIRVEVDEVGLE